MTLTELIALLKLRHRAELISEQECEKENRKVAPARKRKNAEDLQVAPTEGRKKVYKTLATFL